MFALNLIILFLLGGTSALAMTCQQVFDSTPTQQEIRNFKMTGVVYKSAQRPAVGDRWWEDGFLFYNGQVNTVSWNFNASEGQPFHQTSHRGFGLQKIFYNPSWAEGAIRGMDLVHINYGDRITEDEKSLITDLDSETFVEFERNNQIGYAGVELEGKLVGFLRVIDGNNGELPEEKTLKSKRIQCDYFQQLRDSGYRIFELGKYTLSKELNPSERKKVRNALFKWLLNTYYLNQGPNRDKIIFIINVRDKIAERAYKRDFGATNIDAEFFHPELVSPHADLEVPAHTLYLRLSKIIESDP
ncbi:MAG: hypothetical protein ACXVCP_15435 [Bdellovibrio sp.]